MQKLGKSIFTREFIGCYKLLWNLNQIIEYSDVKTINSQNRIITNSLES